MLETRLCLHVDCFDLCREFYEKKLGWTIYSEWDRGEDHRGVIYEINGSYLEFLPASKPNTTDFSSSFYWYVEVADIDSLILMLQEKGCELSGVQETAWKHKQCIVRGPAGFQIKFFQKI